MTETLRIDVEKLTPDVCDRLAGLIVSYRPQVVAIDGFPGTGKTQFSSRVRSALLQQEVPVSLFGTDVAVCPREERAGKGNFEGFETDMLTTILGDVASGAQLSFPAYSTVTGRRDDVCNLALPLEGVVMLEGSMSVEVVERTARFRRLIVRLTDSLELSECKALRRDVQQKGLPTSYVLNRIEQRRADLQNYYSELDRDLRRCESWTK